MNKPFLPEDAGLKRARPCVYLHRAAAAHVRSFLTKESPERCAKQMFGNDTVTDMVLRAASSPATVGTAGWAGVLAQQVVDDTVASITSVSAAAGLFTRGTKTSFDGAAQIKIPGHLVDANDAGTWIGEDIPVPVRAQRMTAGPVLTPHKLMVMVAFTNEMIRSSNIEEISRALINEAVALKLDQTLFGTQAGDAVTPPGLLGASATSVAPASGGGTSHAEACIADLKGLIGALVSVGAGRDPVLVMSPQQAVALSLFAGPLFKVPVLTSTSIPAGTLIMVEASSFVSAFGTTPEFLAGHHMTIHMEDATPADPIMGGTPVKSPFQSDMTVLRMILRASWGMRNATVGTGKTAVAYIVGATW
jgi:Phage capsid family